MSSRVRLWPLALAFAGACAALTVHFIFTLLYVLPANPLNVQYRQHITRYMSPVFNQHWGLFAPNPPYESKSVLVGCRVRQEDGSEVETELVNVTQRLLEAQRAFPLTPAVYLMRAQVGPLPIMFPMKSDLQRRIETAEVEATPELEAMRTGYEEERKKLHAKGLEFMARVASAECRRLHPGKDIVSVRPVAVLQSVPKFSQRHLESAPTQHRTHDLGWHAYVPLAPL